MQSKNNCTGSLYKISGKSYCVKEKNTRSKRHMRTRRHKRTSKKPRTSRTKKASRKITRRKRAGGPGDGKDDTKCCMCGKKVDKDNSLMPSGCKIQHGLRAHRICQECWFKPETGFAIEGRSHKCPGCEKGLPLTHVEQKPIELVDLTEDD